MLPGSFEQMIEAVFKNFGHVNRFVEDGLALPGGLRDNKFQEELARRAAMEMRTLLSEAENVQTYTIKIVS